MKIVSIEESLYEIMLNQIEMLISGIDKLHQKSQDKIFAEWLDCRQVCAILKISPQTLQHFRETGKIGFSQINRKVYYKSVDIKKLLHVKIAK